VSGVLVVTNACAFYTAHAGARHPAFPTPSLGGETTMHNSGAPRRGAECVLKKNLKGRMAFKLGQPI